MSIIAGSSPPAGLESGQHLVDQVLTLAEMDIPELERQVQAGAWCAHADLDTEAWFPIARQVQAARREAAEALQVCEACPVRARCLALGLRVPAGQWGIWGGLVDGEVTRVRRAIATRQAGTEAVV